MLPLTNEMKIPISNETKGGNYCPWHFALLNSRLYEFFSTSSAFLLARYVILSYCWVLSIKLKADPLLNMGFIWSIIIDWINFVKNNPYFTSQSLIPSRMQKNIHFLPYDDVSYVFRNFWWGLILVYFLIW